MYPVLFWFIRRLIYYFYLLQNHRYLFMLFANKNQLTNSTFCINLFIFYKNLFMSDKKDQLKPQAQITQVEQKSKLETPTVKQQSLGKNQKKVDLKNKKIEGKRLALVFYEIAKTKQSVFTQEQKYPIVAAMGGLFMTLCSATIVNFGQSIFKPDQKKKRLFLLFGAANVFAAIFLGGYSIYKISDMYFKVPEEQWDRIAQQKQAYNKLSYSQKKAYLMNDLNQEQQKLVENVTKSQLLKNQERIELTK